MTREEIMAEIPKLESRIAHGEEMLAWYRAAGDRMSALRVSLNNLGMRMQRDTLERELGRD